jgi:hypothetical protein
VWPAALCEAFGGVRGKKVEKSKKLRRSNDLLPQALSRPLVTDYFQPDLKDTTNKKNFFKFLLNFLLQKNLIRLVFAAFFNKKDTLK